jgi:hypothetical protein
MGLSPHIVQHCTSTIHFKVAADKEDITPARPIYTEFIDSFSNLSMDLDAEREPSRPTSSAGRQAMKRSPHSDPGLHQHQPAISQSATIANSSDSFSSSPQQQQQGMSLEQWSLVLDTIRTNLTLIVSTWGRDSRQYSEAREVMIAYLEQNLRALNTGSTGNYRQLGDRRPERQRDGDLEMEDHAGSGDGARGEVVRRGIEDLMGELRI